MNNYAKNVCVPSILSGGSLPSQSSKGSGISHVDCASLASSDVVSDTVGNVGISPDSVTSIGGPIALPPRSSTSIDSVKWADSSGVESLRGRLQTAGFSQESSDLLLESRRSGTRAAYKAPWKRWWDWCVERKVDPLQASVGHVAKFLTTMLNDRDLKYSTLNLHRSAISAYHPPIEGFQVGQHPLI